MYTEGHRNLEKINKWEAYTSYINSHCIYKRYTLYFFVDTETGRKQYGDIFGQNYSATTK